ncbi:DoxX family protein [Dokdonia sp. 4H-3-7-5]|uniref:DoxX family protein n=1 Tax=Dokdonia sp. (strain 4H-3-7-5) TaxID=983548 RepID=UPI00020A6A4A|nr:DoxX family protein [Dokdonia sp. 4H-3-7-5]AEE20695.1 hypothetical protein Krodi_2719 [Dokdonia sp. 4H-3-7-5]
MTIAHTVLIGLIGFSFLYYGVSCLSSNFMTAEFERFGLSKLQRKITGVAQIIGGLGVLIGYFYKPLQIAALMGISLLMLLGWGVRLKIKDSFIAALPSFVFFVLNAYLAYYLIFLR